MTPAMLLRFWLLTLVGAVVAMGSGGGPVPFFEGAALTDGVNYPVGNITYFANTLHPRRSWKVHGLPNDGLTPITVLLTNQTVITGRHLQDTVQSYLDGDDVICEGFLTSILLYSNTTKARLDPTASAYLHQLNATRIYIDSRIRHKFSPLYKILHVFSDHPLPPGPYTAVASKNTLNLLDTFRLYVDEYSTFMTGVYPANSNTSNFLALQSMSSTSGAPLIPVPSRIHSWTDPRPLAGRRVAVKDLFDLQGLQTSAGSKAWLHITEPANATAPAIQHLVDLGAVIVGKYKLAQFAFGSNPWQWTDIQPPFNPRGDGYLTCAASSSGGGCAVAAYDWLDFAVGTDTTLSIRKPAAVTGTFGNRPSQGMISLQGVVPMNWAQDTVGVFARDPVQWARFAKAWYTPQLHQDPNITGLSPLSVPDTMAFPKRILYPDEYFPLDIPKAQEIFDNALARMATHFNMTITHMNLTAMVMNATIYPGHLPNWDVLMNASAFMTTYPQWVDVASPLISTWARQNDGRFPPIDPGPRAQWWQMDASGMNQSAYDQAVQTRRMAVEWVEQHLLFETAESCSESVLICDGGTGGLPSFREDALNNSTNATFLGLMPEGAQASCPLLCSMLGCADYSIPLGQLPYESPVSHRTEQWPVGINLIVRRGCDFMLFNLVEKMAEAGIIGAVKTGRTAF